MLEGAGTSVKYSCVNYPLDDVFPEKVLANVYYICVGEMGLGNNKQGPRNK